jgi:hypothetical protein
LPPLLWCDSAHRLDKTTRRRRGRATIRLSTNGLARQFIDEVFGQVNAFLLGRRLFSDQGIATGLALDESRTTPSGVTISVYRPTGRPEFGTAEVT